VARVRNERSTCTPRATRSSSRSTSECFRRHGGFGRGTTYFGDRELLSPLAVNPVKAAHEFSHVELAARVGALRALLRAPSWFDEGLAVLFSEHPVFAEDHWLVETSSGATAPTLDQLASMAGWLAASRDRPARGGRLVRTRRTPGAGAVVCEASGRGGVSARLRRARLAVARNPHGRGGSGPTGGAVSQGDCQQPPTDARAPLGAPRASRGHVPARRATGRPLRDASSGIGQGECGRGRRAPGGARPT